MDFPSEGWWSGISISGIDVQIQRKYANPGKVCKSRENMQIQREHANSERTCNPVMRAAVGPTNTHETFQVIAGGGRQLNLCG